MMQPATVVRQDQEYVQYLKANGRHREEVDRYHGLDVILQERPPGLSIRACGPRNLMKMAQSQCGTIAGARSSEIDVAMEKSRL